MRETLGGVVCDWIGDVLDHAIKARDHHGPIQNPFNKAAWLHTVGQ